MLSLSDDDYELNKCSYNLSPDFPTMDAFSAFDFVEIRHDCWQQCESNPNAYNDAAKLPLYRLMKWLRDFRLKSTSERSYSSYLNHFEFFVKHTC